MTTSIPSLTARRLRGRTRLAVAAAAAVLVLSACGASGGSDSSKDTTTAPATTTEAPETTTTAATATTETERTATEPAPADTVFQIADTLYETDLTSPEPGGWPPANDNHEYGPDGLTITLDADRSVYSTPADETFPGNIMVEARWAVSPADPQLVGRGVACRSSKAGAYVAAVTESPISADAWSWGIYKKTDGAFDQLIGTGIDGENTITAGGGSNLSLSLGCARTVQGEQLMLFVGDELAGITVDVDPLNGAYTSLATVTGTTGGSVLVTDFRVSETVPT